MLPISHDEVVHGKGSLLRKMPGDRWQQLANLRAYLGFMWAHPGKQLLFMGSEFGQEAEWAEARELDWWLLDHPEHRGVQRWCATSTRPTPDRRALWPQDDDPAGFQLDRRQRRRPQRLLVRARGPRHGRRRWSASRTSPPSRTRGTGSACRPRARGTRCSTPTPTAYGGSGVGNLGGVNAVDGVAPGQPAHAAIVVPPLATVWLRARRLSGRATVRAGAARLAASALTCTRDR